MIILNSQESEESIDKMINSVGKEIETQGGRLEQIDRLGRKEFAYPSKKRTAGYYVNYYFEAEPDALEKIRASLRLNDAVHLQHYQISGS